MVELLLINSNNSGLIIAGPASGCRLNNSMLSQLIGFYERDLVNKIKKYVNPGDTVFDIGANRGFITLVLSKRVGKKGKVYSFEPILSTYENLEKTITDNKIQNVCLNNLAISDKTGSVIFRMPIGDDSSASMNWHVGLDNTIEYDINCIAIDDHDNFKNLTPRFIKIDVEGAEAEVIRGMKKLIERARPIIYMEVSQLGRQYVWDTMISLNYSCYSCKDENKIKSFEQYIHNDFIWIFD